MTQTPNLQEVWATLDMGAMETLTHDQHIAKVAKGGYAYIGDLTSFDKALADNCDLDVISDRFFASGYGVGLQNNSQYLGTLNAAWVSTAAFMLVLSLNTSEQIDNK